MSQNTKINTLTELLGALQRGGFHDKATREINDLLATMAQAQCDTGAAQKGVINISLTFNLKEFVTVTPSLKVTAPKEPTQDSVFFLSADNKLSRQDPRQSQLELDERRAERQIGGVA